MPIAIYLRRDAATNHYRRTMVNALNAGHGDRAWLSSGFFQERGKFSLSSQSDFVSAIKRLRSLTTIGVYSHPWLGDYRTFTKGLQRAGVKVSAMQASRLRWHAKVFVLATRARPLFAIVGSSNLTRAAFDFSAPFNWEADVAIWTEKGRVSRAFERAVITDVRRQELIVADYDPAKNGGLTIDQRLEGLVEDLRAVPTIPVS